MIRGYHLTTSQELISALLRIRRKQQKIFQRDIAKKLGITQQAYARKEKECTFRLSEFIDACDYIGIDPAELIKEALRR